MQRENERRIAAIKTIIWMLVFGVFYLSAWRLGALPGTSMQNTFPTSISDAVALANDAPDIAIAWGVLVSGSIVSLIFSIRNTIRMERR